VRDDEKAGWKGQGRIHLLPIPDERISLKADLHFLFSLFLSLSLSLSLARSLLLRDPYRNHLAYPLTFANSFSRDVHTFSNSRLICCSWKRPRGNSGRRKTRECSGARSVSLFSHSITRTVVWIYVAPRRYLASTQNKANSSFFRVCANPCLKEVTIKILFLFVSYWNLKTFVLISSINSFFHLGFGFITWENFSITNTYHYI